MRILLLFLLLAFQNFSYAKDKCLNQTEEITPVLSGDTLPFEIKIEVADFAMPIGIHSYASGIYQGKWIFLAGRTNGMHGFQEGETGLDNFPVQMQNTSVVVVDPITKHFWHKSLLSDKTSGLTTAQVDTLSATNPQSAQVKDTLYITGGYGNDSTTNKMVTHPYLTAVNLPGIMHWVMNPHSGETASQYIRQIKDPVFQVTGGYMDILDDDLNALLIFGQNFSGYYAGDANGEYTNQVRRFKILDDGRKLSFTLQKHSEPNPNYRRRDLNITPIMCRVGEKCEPAFLALSGVFTEDMGAWTIPVHIKTNGANVMRDPKDPKAFKQSMNAYNCPTLSLYSEKSDDLYMLLFGGISFGRFTDGKFNTHKLLPFINDITAIKVTRDETYSQYHIGRFPLIRSSGMNRGNELLFGTGGGFFTFEHLPAYYNGVLKLDHLGTKPIVLGYIVGGVQSTVDNTLSYTDTCATSYIFRVTLIPK